MRSSMIERALMAGSLAAALAWSGGASAQALIVDPQHIAHCLCLEQSVAQRAADMNARRQAYDQRTSELAMLDQRIARERGMVNEADPVQVARFRDSVEQRDRLAESIDRAVIGDLQASIGRYNEQVAAHRQSCGGAYYEQNTLERVRMTLTCPRM